MHPPPLIDTHCHLDFELFDASREAILAACRRVGVARILVPGVRASGWERLLALCDANPMLAPALGLHPCFVAEHRPDDLLRLEQLLTQHVDCALGEVGLDFWAGRADEAVQRRYFEAQLALAARLQRPLLLHVRKAHDETQQMIRRSGLSRGGIVHAFSGSLQQAERYLALGFRLGVGGAITYPRAHRLRRTLAALPLEALVLETDAPDMPLAGYQGEPNRPDRLPRVLEQLAELRQLPLEALAQALWRNSVAALGWSD